MRMAQRALTCRAFADSVKLEGSTENFQTNRYFASAPTMLIQATQLRPGMILEYNNGLWRVMAISHITPGNWRGMVQTKLRNVKTGTQTENRFRSEDRVERIILSQIEMEFLYQEGDDFHFMNTETYDQITIPKELIEDVVGFLTPNLKVEVEFHETTPLNVSLPKTVNLKVVQTDPGMRSAAVTNTLKPATMETGLTVQVPHFVQEGETITINTETREYMARAK
jgi:elongation factor P